jgi:SAM-dependent methyltransferase
VAQAAIDKGIPTRVDFFGEAIAGDILAGGAADLIVGNNVLAQVPDLNDFVRGMKVLLKPGGVITLEFPHLERLIEGNQFDTIYHEHYSYFSFMTVRQILRAHGLAVFDVEELPSHGGSLRVFARHEDGPQAVSDRVPELDARERAAGVTGEAYYARFAEKVQATKRALLEVLIRAKGEGLSIAGYGAPGKGNILLNYCGIRTDFLDYTVDRNPYKQGRYLPGTHVPIRHPDHIRETRPDLVLILPWNLEAEIVQQLAYIREWGGRFLIPIPEARIIP